MTDCKDSLSLVSPTRYVKLIRKDRTHFGLVLQEGFNCIKEPESVDERPECGSGLHFCRETDVGYWFHLYGDDLGFIATVTLCPDSICVSMDKYHKLKADKIILGPFHSFETFMTIERAEQVVQATDSFSLQYLPQELKTAAMCLAAVRDYGYSIHYVPAELLTEALCLAAVQRDSFTFHYIPYELKTAAICLAAVQLDGCMLQRVPEIYKTPSLCFTAVKQNGFARMYVPVELRCLDHT